MREKTTQGGVTAEKKKDGVPISYWSAALNMLAWKAGLSYGKIQVWAQFHPEEYGKWMHELRLSYEKAAEDGTLKDGIVTLSIFVGVVAVIAAKTGTALLPVLFMALYFLVSAIGVAWNAAAGRYVVVRAAAVACEEQRDAVRQKRSVYRFIPVDEDGNYLSEQGAYDIFLDFASKKKSPRFNFFIGRTYVLVFHIDNSRQLNERTLAAVYTG